MKLVVALGGNALVKPGQEGTSEQQFETTRQTVEAIVRMIEHGHEVVLTHGNGPQVGSLLLQQEIAKEVTPPMPLDVCGAMSQGQVGYMMAQCMTMALRARQLDKHVATVVTQVLVDEDDPAFDHPTKPVGPVYRHDDALRRIKEGYRMTQQKGGWRIVVPSPDPRSILESEVIEQLIDTGHVVIAVGGGGIPVVERDDGLQGVEAVIDKDLAAEELASEIEADALLILTDVDAVYLNYGEDDQQKLEEAALEEIEQHYHDGQFPPGSMGPKVLAAIRFLKNGGKTAIIASIDNAWDALQGTAGTRIVR
ncbi:MAG: carbamate kinase [Thermoplasmatota archaeon]